MDSVSIMPQDLPPELQWPTSTMSYTGVVVGIPRERLRSESFVGIKASASANVAEAPDFSVVIEPSLQTWELASIATKRRTRGGITFRPDANVGEGAALVSSALDAAESTDDVEPVHPTRRHTMSAGTESRSFTTRP